MIDRRSFFRGGSALMAHASFPQVLTAFLAGCATTAKNPRRPVFFSEEDMRRLAILVDLILPATDSPAASMAGTHEFIDLALSACATPQQQQAMRAGLAALIAEGFDAMSQQERSALLQRRAQADISLPYGQSFFKILKDYTLTGFFHSEIGATQALAYESVPGGFQGDIALTPEQKAWAI
jgi:Gluconate 2-dehydrogenase subunit 3